MGKIKTRETKTMPMSNSQFSKGNVRKNHRTKQEEYSSLRRLGDSKRKVFFWLQGSGKCSWKRKQQSLTLKNV